MWKAGTHWLIGHQICTYVLIVCVIYLYNYIHIIYVLYNIIYVYICKQDMIHLPFSQIDLMSPA